MTMILPNDEQCRLVIAEILEGPQDAYVAFAWEFAESNERRVAFTDRQKEVIHNLCYQYEFKCMKGYR